MHFAMSNKISCIFSCSSPIVPDGSTSSRFYTLMSPKTGHFQHVKNISEMTNEMKGFQLLSYLLPHHTQTSQSFIYIVALLLGRPISEISYGTQFNSETLMKMLEMAKPASKTSTSKKAHKSLKFEAVNVLLSFLRYLLHNVRYFCYTYSLYNFVCTVQLA